LSRCAVARKQQQIVRIVCAATSRNHKKRKKSPSDGNARVELDSHADAAVFHKDCRVINDTGTVVSVDGFEPVTMKVNGIPIVMVAVAYDCPAICHTFILFFHQVMHVLTMTRHLINPFQMRNYGIKINETALMHLTPEEWTPKMHSILVDDPPLHIPLRFDGGTMSGFTSRMPMDEELQDYDQTFTTQVVMTTPSEWKPWSKEFKRIEAALCTSLTSGFETCQVQGIKGSHSSPIEGTGHHNSLGRRQGRVCFIASDGGVCCQAKKGGVCHPCPREN
jgi:hypothetical protein